MSEVAKAVKPLFDKFIDFFDIFDLSFFVSGATFIGAVAWADLTPSLTQLVVDLMLTMPSIAVVMLALASYVSGMTCFALGRWIRGQLRAARERVRDRRAERSDDPELQAVRAAQRRRKQHRLFEELCVHGVLVRDANTGTYAVHEDFDRIPWLSRYMVDGGLRHESALYVRLWAEVRQRERFAPSFSLVRRYWVSAATLDGLFVACLTWAALLALIEQPDHAHDHFAILALHHWLPSAATIVGALFCLREAGRYDEHQYEELVATLLYAYDLPDEALLDFVPPMPHETAAQAKVAAGAAAKAPAGAAAKPKSEAES